MERQILKRLIDWKNNKSRKPLLIRGARQVGKTWVMQEFGKLYFKKALYVNFERDKSLQGLFEKDFDLRQILLALSIQTGVQPEPENTLIIFDEIQEAKGGLTALKYFQEQAPEYYLVGAGSLLGVALSGQSFPVGKVDFLELYPLNFSEFLLAVGEEKLVTLLTTKDWNLIQTFHSQFVNLLKQYYFTGGMPEVVARYSREKNFDEVKTVQKNILAAYEQDFSKHAPAEIIPRLRMLWNSIPSQLSKENKKFIYGLVREGARAREYELALSWLEDYGLVYKINRITKAAFPLKAYADQKAFKLYMADIGLLGAMAGLSEKILLEGDALFSEFKGALTEQFVLQQLIAECGIHPFYWSQERAASEVDFVLEKENHFYPVEVKAAENLHSKSLKIFHEKFHPEISIRTSLSGYRKETWMVNVPLYGLHEMVKAL
ncbi:MAG: ATPase [Sphingobacteriales bacterium UTBCD1]|jgi:predicted AAA+ superfamily ATPase|nr:MAG: ATPase [Sphingobacteriales bacterium UTBCD1]